MCVLAACRENELHKSMASLQRMSDATESVYESLLRLQNSLSDDDPLFGDLQTVHVLTNEHRVRAAFDLARTPHTHTHTQSTSFTRSRLISRAHRHRRACRSEIRAWKFENQCLAFLAHSFIHSFVFYFVPVISNHKQ